MLVTFLLCLVRDRVLNGIDLPTLSKGRLSSQRVCVGVDTSLQTALKGQLQSSTHFKESKSLLLTRGAGCHDGHTHASLSTCCAG